MAGRYKILEELGAGGAGRVHKAYDTQLDRYVALKRLLSKEEVERQDSQSADLKKEAGSLATLQHPNIVTIYDLGSDDEGTFIVMELLEGDTLADWIRGSALSLTDFYELATQTLEGVLNAHSLSILHRDLKPENIKVRRMPGGRLQAKIVDFGLARLSYGAKKQTEDQRGNVLGSIFYMAPEQFQRKPLDGRTDLYSLGCVYYQCLTGRRPFEHGTMAGVMQLHLEHRVALLHDLRPDLPQQICDWVMWLMNKDPQDRPANAQMALDTLRALHATGQFLEYPTGQVRPISGPVRPATGGVGRPPTGSVSQRITASTPSRPISSSVHPQYASGGVIHTTALIDDRDEVQYATPAQTLRKKSSAWIWIVLAVGVCGSAGGWFLLHKPSVDNTVVDAGTGKRVAPAKISEGLISQGAIIHWSAADGAIAFSDSGAKNPAKNGEPVVEVRDLFPTLAGEATLVAYDHKQSFCPKLVVEQPDGFKAPLAALQFEAGQGMMHRVDLGSREVKSYPMGEFTPVKGFTLMFLVKPWLLQKESRLIRLRSQNNDDMFDVIATPANEYKLRARIGGKVKELKMSNRNTAIYSLVTVMLDAKTNKVIFNVRSQDGGKNHQESEVAPGCHLLNEIRFSEQPKDATHPVAETDKLAGFIAEVFLWPAPMNPNDRTAQEQKIAEFYFKNPGSRW